MFAHSAANNVATAGRASIGRLVTLKTSRVTMLPPVPRGSTACSARTARMGRNPATGASIKIKASNKIDFRASKDLKELLALAQLRLGPCMMAGR